MERPQDVQFVPLFVRSASRELTDKLRDSLLPLRPGESLEIGRFGEIPDGSHDAIDRTGSLLLRSGSGGFTS